MLEEEVSKPLRNPDNKEVHSQCITRFSTNSCREIRDELKGILDFPHLGKGYYDFIEEISKISMDIYLRNYILRVMFLKI